MNHGYMGIAMAIPLVWEYMTKGAKQDVSRVGRVILDEL